MERRIALKNMGLALGFTVATPTLISIVQSCKSEKVLEWTPDFFTPEEGSVLTHLVDIILPKTDTPSATEVQVNIFIDRFIDQVIPKEQQDFAKMTIGKFIEKALKDSGKENAGELGPEDLEPVLASSLKITKEQEEVQQKAIEEFMMAMGEGKSAELNDEAARFAFANSLREMTIWGYKTTEYIGEEVLAYLPVPGEYIGCGDVNELTGGKAWSL
ncbi:gluconate 2-dehydrogenase subunit 3 family protein [Poritiphilus flavus]|uniref:Gluconate 2-dehydrogenase subunit 3 family protein n=1 Tax=Poritiphilus flavus TaxID=2697053 RepID=A0A6L9E7Z7_9FLAO|nr:gluconate 2-dehydrogenase subunit 3 family protein [Poritiphilus flavus]NAS10820.1 gluconate 2-dehydrogenase subunit 3 family protein [Poritiphilus flavus]